MTRKDYILIAACLRTARTPRPAPHLKPNARYYANGHNDAIDKVTALLITALSEDNPSFNPLTFLAATKPEPVQ